MKKVFLLISTLFLACSIHAEDIFKKHGFDKEILTLSKGRYEEVFSNDEVVQVGSVLLNTKTNKVVRFLDEETEDTSFKAEHSSRFLTIDPLAEKFPWMSPYAYCNNNPINAIDPDGRSTWVLNNSDGTYRVVGGDLNDNDLNIYVYSIQDGQLVRGESIGITSSSTSFYNDTQNNETGEVYGWMGTINPNDNSGADFLGDMFNNTPTMDNYIANAGNNESYDFKSHGQGGGNVEEHNYRGMPIATKDGVTMYTSARDVGNIAAGYVAASNGMSWKATRVAFDAYQMKQNGFGKEGQSSQNAQSVGFNIGLRTNSPAQKSNNLQKTINSTLKSIWNAIIK